MTGTKTYPQFPVGIETRFAAVKMAAGDAEDARAYLDDPACPYSLQLKEILRVILLGGSEGALGANGNLAVAPLFLPDAAQDDEARADLVLDEVQATIDAMRNIERSLDADDTDGRMSLLKSKTGLLEKWVQIKERAYGIKQVAEFQRLVMSVLDAKLAKDDIQDLKKRLKELAEGA